MLTDVDRTSTTLKKKRSKYSDVRVKSSERRSGVRMGEKRGNSGGGSRVMSTFRK